MLWLPAMMRLMRRWMIDTTIVRVHQHGFHGVNARPVRSVSRERPDCRQFCASKY
jgi:hypothetical protein